MSRWYRAHCGLVTDAKLAEAALLAECSRAVIIACWHAILESAAAVNESGRYDTSARRVSAILAEPGGLVERVFAAFADLGMVQDGRVTAWTRRQFESDSSTERSRKHREAKRSGELLRAHMVEPPAFETSVQRCATAPDTETESYPPLPKSSLSVACELEAGTGEGFERFWRAMPSPDPAAKAAALAAFARLDAADQAAAIAAAGRYATAFAAKPTTRPISPARFIREGCFRGYGPSAPAGKTMCFVRVDTPQWRAWQAYRGRPVPLNREGTGWHFPSEWPTQQSPEAC